MDLHGGDHAHGLTVALDCRLADLTSGGNGVKGHTSVGINFL